MLLYCIMLKLNVFADKNQFRILMILFFLATFLLRMNVTGKGHMHYPDELRYRYAFSVVDEIQAGHIKQGLSNMFRAYCRPAFVMLSIGPAMAQRLMDPEVGKGEQLNVERDDLRTYVIPSIINVFVSMGIILLMYKFLFYATKDRFISFAGMLVYSMMNTSFMEIRHMVPYYWAQLLFLGLIFMLITDTGVEKDDKKKIFLYGILAGFSFSVYPGFYNLFFTAMGLVFFISSRRIRQTAVFLGGALVFPLIFEAISQYAGLPNFGNKHQLECVYEALPTNPPSSWDFAWIVKYALGMEGILGGILAAVFIYFLVRHVIIKRDIDRKAWYIFIFTIAAYVFIVTMLYLFGKFSLRVKYCHPFFFIMVFGAFMAVARVRKPMRATVVSLLVSLSALSFIFYYSQYMRAIYPRDLRQYMRETYPGALVMQTAEYYPLNMQRAALLLSIKENYDYLGVNLRTPGGPGDGTYHFIDLGADKLIINEPYTDTVYTPFAVSALSFNPDKTKNRMKVYKLR